MRCEFEGLRKPVGAALCGRPSNENNPPCPPLAKGGEGGFGR